jgi:hypothetical protein
VRSHRCEEADGNNLCTPVPPGRTDYLGSPPAPLPYALEQVLDFTRPDGNARRYLTFGWADARSDGTWTEGPLAMLRLGLSRSIDAASALDLEVDAAPFLAPPRHPTLDVDVVVNGREIARWRYDTTSLPRRSARIPAGVIANGHGLDVEFRVRNPESPQFVGTGTLPHFLGLNMRSLVVRSAPPAR